MGRLGFVRFSFCSFTTKLLMCLFSWFKSSHSIKEAKQTKTKKMYHKNQIGQHENIDGSNRTARKYWRFHLLSKCAPANAIYSMPMRTGIYSTEFKKTYGSELCCPKGACAVVKYTLPRHTSAYHKEEITRTLSYIYRNWYYLPACR